VKDHLQKTQSVGGNYDLIFSTFWPCWVWGHSARNFIGDIYTVYADRGRDNELSYRRTLCSGRVHVACSSCNSAQSYVCDYRCL